MKKNVMMTRSRRTKWKQLVEEEGEECVRKRKKMRNMRMYTTSRREC